MTKGEYRVGLAFNPSQDPTVDIIKAMTAQLINAVEAIDNQQNPERARLKSLAQTAYEEAAMWAVKAATKQSMPAEIAGERAFPTPAPAADPFVEAVRSGVMAVMGSLGPWELPKVMGPSEFLHVLSHLQKRGFNGATNADIDLVLRDLRQTKP